MTRYNNWMGYLKEFNLYRETKKDLLDGKYRGWAPRQKYQSCMMRMYDMLKVADEAWIIGDEETRRQAGKMADVWCALGQQFENKIAAERQDREEAARRQREEEDRLAAEAERRAQEARDRAQEARMRRSMSVDVKTLSREERWVIYLTNLAEHPRTPITEAANARAALERIAAKKKV
jgi:hypothetical protein